MKDLLAIYDADTEYALRLRDALNKENGFPYYAEVAKSEEELESLVRDSGAEVLLTSGGNPAPEGVKTVIRLTDAPGYAGGEPAVFRYQPAEKIRDAILKCRRVSEGLEEDRVARLHRETWIGVASPVGRALKTSFSLVLGQLLSQRQKTLYVNLEPCPGTAVLFGTGFSKDLSELLYEGMKADWDGSGEFTATVHGLDVLVPAAVPEDVYQTDPAFLSAVIRKFASANQYETVVADLGSEFRLTEAFLPFLDKLYVPTRNEPLQEAKVAEYREWLTRVTDPSFEHKTEVLSLPAPGLFSRGKFDPEQLVFTELGDAVRTLLGGLY